MTGPTRGHGDPDATVEKLMTITRAEFETGLRRLAGTAPKPDGRGGYLLAEIGAGRQAVRCSFESLSDALLGGLMKLPRARVSLHLGSLPPEARAEFVAAFDRTFQRGGG